MNKVIIAVVALLLIGAGIFFVMNQGEEAEAPTNTQQTQENNNADEPEETTPPTDNTTQVTITYTDDGFSPASYTAAAGATIVIKNDSSMPLDFASDEHPTHTENPELNAGVIAPGGDASIVLDEKGDWGFHNHQFSTHEGSITVE